jgi:hypothetical protein
VVILIPHIYRTKILKIVRHRLDGIVRQESVNKIKEFIYLRGRLYIIIGDRNYDFKSLIDLQVYKK